MRKYLSVFRMRFHMETQYRGAVLGGIACQAVFGLILISVYIAMFRSKPQTISLADTVTYVWLQQAFFRMITSDEADLKDNIRSGSIAYDMCRPLDLYGYYYTRILAMKLVGSVMRAVPMIAVALLLPGEFALSAPVSFGALLAFLAGVGMGMLSMSAFSCIAWGITLRTIDNQGITNMLNLVILTLAGNILPLTLFPDSWQAVLEYLPGTQMLDMPIRLYTGQAALGAFPRVFAVQLFWLIALVLIGRAIWTRNMRKIIVQGG